MKALMKDCKTPKVVDLVNTYTQTDLPYRRNYHETGVVFGSASITQRESKQSSNEEDLITVSRSKMDRMRMQIEDLLTQRIEVLAKLESYQRRLEEADVESKIIAYRKLFKSNPVQYLLPKIKRGERDSMQAE